MYCGKKKNLLTVGIRYYVMKTCTQHTYMSKSDAFFFSAQLNNL